MTQLPESRISKQQIKCWWQRQRSCPHLGFLLKFLVGEKKKKDRYLTSFDFFSVATTNYFEHSQRGPSSLPLSWRVLFSRFKTNAAPKKGDHFTSDVRGPNSLNELPLILVITFNPLETSDVSKVPVCRVLALHSYCPQTHKSSVSVSQLSWTQLKEKHKFYGWSASAYIFHRFPNFNVHQDHLQHLLDVLDFVPGGADSVGLEPENSHFFFFFFKFSDDSDATRAGPQRPSSLNSIVPKGRA